MNRIFIACGLFSLAAAAVVPEDAQAEIVKYQSDNDGTGNYKFSFETSNGITREETGHLVNIGQENEHMEVEGSYSYIDVDGKPMVVRYTAGENGYIVAPPVEEVAPRPIAPPSFSVPAGVVASLLGK